MEGQLDTPLQGDLHKIAVLDARAEALRAERRYVRASKLCAAAVERAPSLAALGDDSHVITLLQVQQAMMLLLRVEAPFVTPTEPLPATGNDMPLGAAAEQALQLLLSAAGAMRRRRAAGTLRRGACRAVEEAFALAIYAVSHPDEVDVEHAPGLAAVIGENTYLHVASTALFAFNLLAQVQTLASAAAGHERGILDLVAFVREAFDLVRTLPHVPMSLEIIRFAKICERIISVAFQHARGRHLRAGSIVLVPLLKSLRVSWAALQRTPVMQRALAPDMRAEYALNESATISSMHNLAEGRQRCCAHCGTREAVLGDFKACGRCRNVFYCSSEHQHAHWRAHKAACCSDGGAAAGKE